MQKKIFGNIIIVAVIAAVLMCVVLFLSQYSVVEKQLTDDLDSKCDYIINGISSVDDDSEYFESIGENAEERITVINKNGEVIYDNIMPSLENHKHRPEVEGAFLNGSARAVRFSDTQQIDIVYVAKLMPDGNVLRISAMQENIWELMAMHFPYIIIVFAIVLVAAFLFSRFISRSIVEPFNSLDLDNPMQNDTYPELKPLLSRLELQHNEIDERIKQLTAKQTEFNQVTENMREGLILLDRFKDVMTINKSAAKIFDIDKDEATGLNIFSLDSCAEMKKCIEKAEKGLKGSAVIERNERKYRVLSNDVSVDGKVGGIVILVIDITDKFLAEKSRKEFSANVSHELKTPLTSISGYAEIIKDGFVNSEDVPVFAGRIFSEAQRLLVLINDIIKLSQLDEDSIEMKKEKTDIFVLACTVCERLKDVAAKEDVSISVDGRNTFIMGISKIIDEILENLVENAVKYNKKGGSVFVSVGEKDGHAFVTVKDTGVGIPEEHRKSVFERFYRVDKSHSKMTGGTGLGLSIVKHGVSLHGGSITLESEEGKGTEINIIF